MPLEQHPTDPGKLVFRAHPAALRLADRLEGRWALHPEMQEAAAELRRLAAENEALQNTKHYEAPRGFVLNPDYLVPELRAQRDALLEALKLIVQWDEAGLILLDHHIERARAAIKQAEGEKT